LQAATVQHQQQQQHESDSEDEAVAESRASLSGATALDLDVDSEAVAGLNADLAAADEFANKADRLDAAMESAEAMGDMDAQLDDVAFLQQQISETESAIDASQAEIVSWSMVEQQAEAQMGLSDADAEEDSEGENENENDAEESEDEQESDEELAAAEEELDEMEHS